MNVLNKRFYISFYTLITLLSLSPMGHIWAQSAPPPFIETAVIRASLQALQRHGLDLSQPMPSKHRVECDTPDIAEDVRHWAQSAGFDVSETDVLHGHGGVPKYVMDLIVIAVPNPSAIRQQALDVIEGVSHIDGATYVTWTGDMGR